MAGEAPGEPSAEQLLQKAWYYEEGLRDLEAAVRTYEQIIRDHADAPMTLVQALKRQSDCYERLGEREKAREVYSRIFSDHYPIEIKKLWADYRVDMRKAQMFEEAYGGGDSEKMAAALETMSPGDIFYRWSQYREQGLKLRKTQPDQAIDALKKAIVHGEEVGRAADSAYLQTVIATIYLDTGRPEEARRAFRIVHDRFADQPELAAWALVSIAEVHRQYDELPEAVKAYAELAEAYPTHYKARAWAGLWMGDCYREMGNLATAYATWREVLDLTESKDTTQPRRVARWLLGIEPVPETWRFQGPWANDVLYFAGVRHQMMGRHSLARRAFQKALDTSSEDWPAVLAQRIVSLYNDLD